MAPHLGRSRLRRVFYGALAVVSLALPVSGTAGPAAVPAPVPAQLAPLETPGAAELAERYAANREAIGAAEQVAADHGSPYRAGVLRAMADRSRQFLFFDGRDGGRTAEVFGDLAGADKVAVLVPGSDTSMDRYRRLRADAAALASELGDGSAVIAWLGYRTPSTVSLQVLTTDRATEAAPSLQAFVSQVSAIAPTAQVSLVCHSYGAVVCAAAAPDLDVGDIVFLGSPGAGVDTVADLHTDATVWAGRSTNDWVADIPHVRIPLLFTTLGLGADPVSPEFGARTFPAGDGGHSHYLKPGSRSLANIASIVSCDAVPDGPDA